MRRFFCQFWPRNLANHIAHLVEGGRERVRCKVAIRCKSNIHNMRDIETKFNLILMVYAVRKCTQLRGRQITKVREMRVYFVHTFCGKETARQIMADEAAAVKHNNEVGNIFDHKVDSSKSIVLCDRFSYRYSTKYAKQHITHVYILEVYSTCICVIVICCVSVTLSTTDKHHAINAKSI